MRPVCMGKCHAMVMQMTLQAGTAISRVLEFGAWQGAERRKAHIWVGDWVALPQSSCKTATSAQHKCTYQSRSAANKF